MLYVLKNIHYVKNVGVKLQIVIQSLPELEKWFQNLQGVLSCDTETDGLKPANGNQACGYSFAYRNEKGVQSCYVPLRHVVKKKESSLFSIGVVPLINLSVPEVNKIVRPYLQNKKIIKVLHHAKFDIQVFWNEDIDIINFHDTMIMSNLLDSRRPNGLKSLMKILLNEEHTEQRDIKLYLDHHDIEDSGYHVLPIETCGPYAARDTNATLRIYEILAAQIHEVEDIYRIERKVIKTIAKMEYKGMPADKAFMKDMYSRLEKSQHNVTRRAYEVAGEPFDMNSSQDITRILYEKLCVKLPKLEAGKTPTDKSTLERIPHILARLIVIHRHISKLMSPYFGPMSDMVSSKGRIHGSFQQVKSTIETVGGFSEENRSGADTGRLSSRDPNLQNVGARRRVWRKGKIETIPQSLVKRAFKLPSAEWQFLMFDYSQIELRVLAHEANDKTLIDAYSRDIPLDIHVITASRIFEEDWIKATEAGNKTALKMLRANGKTTNFGIIYGMGPDRLAVDLGLIDKYGFKKGQIEAKRILQVYFETYPGVRELDTKLKRDFKQHGYVETAYGRRRYMKPSEEYKALNTRVQGTAGDMNKIALYQADEALIKAKAETFIANDIHDEITFQHLLSETHIPDILKTAMEDFPGFRVPIKVDKATAYPTWAHKKGD